MRYVIFLYIISSVLKELGIKKVLLPIWHSEMKRPHYEDFVAKTLTF